MDVGLKVWPPVIFRGLIIGSLPRVAPGSPQGVACGFLKACSFMVLQVWPLVVLQVWCLDQLFGITWNLVRDTNSYPDPLNQKFWHGFQKYGF